MCIYIYTNYVERNRIRDEDEDETEKMTTTGNYRQRGEETIVSKHKGLNNPNSKPSNPKPSRPQLKPKATKL